MICSRLVLYMYVSVHESYFFLQSSVSVMNTMVFMAWWLLSFSSRVEAVRVSFAKLT